ncbi:hypothetical protein LSAT2_024709 [Lamellibrachia satsuma]|nr:hypothetical protein LSAT2_024709 [Lamellibrachia satsuma]
MRLDLKANGGGDIRRRAEDRYLRYQCDWRQPECHVGCSEYLLNIHKSPSINKRCCKLEAKKSYLAQQNEA